MNDLIRRQDAFKAVLGVTTYDTVDDVEIHCDASIADSEGWLGGVRDALRAIEDVPSAEPERKSMVWKPAKGRPAYEKGICNCGYVLSVLQRDFVYCPNCGARIEWGQG